jgi:hypothetical protein
MEITMKNSEVISMKTVGALIIAAIWLAPPAMAQPPTPTPTPPPINATGGQVTGTNQGSSCVGRSGQAQTPATRTDSLWWVEENDWPENAPRTAPQSGVGCSR